MQKGLGFFRATQVKKKVKRFSGLDIPNGFGVEIYYVYRKVTRENLVNRYVIFLVNITRNLFFFFFFFLFLETAWLDWLYKVRNFMLDSLLTRPAISFLLNKIILITFVQAWVDFFNVLQWLSKCSIIFNRKRIVKIDQIS